MSDVYWNYEEEGNLPPIPTSLGLKNVAHLILGAEPPCLPATIPHTCPILINLCPACHFVSR